MERYYSLIDVHGELPSKQRARILSSLTQKTRARLAYQCANHAKPYWQEKFPDDNRPFDLLQQLYNSLYAQSLNPSESRRDIDQLFEHTDELFDLGSEFHPAIYAGFSAWAACHVMCYDEMLTGLSEQETDPDNWDPAFYASCAISGGAYWDTVQGDPIARRIYWEWYLGIF